MIIVLGGVGGIRGAVPEIVFSHYVSAPAADSFITVLKTSIVEALAEYPLHNHGEPRNESRDPALGCISSDRFARLVRENGLTQRANSR